MGNEKDKDKNEIDMYSRLSYSIFTLRWLCHSSTPYLVIIHSFTHSLIIIKFLIVCQALC